MIPAATVCNYPFVLPVGAMSNAIAFERAKWKLSDTVGKKKWCSPGTPRI